MAEGDSLKAYVDWAERQTDAPREFHVFVWLACLAAAAGNRIFWRTWGRIIYPLVYVLLLAPSGRFRKSTALYLGHDILEEAVPKITLPVSFSRERFEEVLAEHSTGFLPISEFGELLGKLSRDYMAGAMELLTDIFDSPRRRTASFKGSGTKTIERPAVTIIGASTVDWLEERVRASALRGGFLARFLFCLATERPEWKGYVPPSEADFKVRESLVESLRQVASVEGEVDFRPTREVLNGFFRQYDAEVSRRGADPRLEGIYSRAELYTMKLAALLMLSRTAGRDLVVADSDIIKAAELVRYSHAQMEGLDLAFTRDEADLRRVRELVGAKPGITQRDVLRRSKLTIRRFEPLIATLVRTGEIHSQREKVPGGEQVRYWPQDLLEAGQE